MSTSIDKARPLHFETPLLNSLELSEKTGMDIWLKLENTQIGSSYKIRGIGLLCQKAVEKGCKHIVSSSGGNAGIAAALAARLLNVPCTVVVPETTPECLVDKIKKVATKVEIYGRAFDDANARAVEIAREPDHMLVHPFDHPDIWEGHSTMVDEIMKQLHGKKPDVVVLSVGGGGLLSGVLQGMHRNGLEHVPLVALETHGAESFNICVRSNQHLALDGINTIAKALGVKKVCKSAFDWIAVHKPIISEVVTDKQAIEAALQFADDHRFLVGPACGATLSAVYSDLLVSLQQKGALPLGRLQAVLIVCGGNEVTLEEIENWKNIFDLKKTSN